MPTSSNVLLHRLIKLYPVKVIREEYEVSGVAQDPMIDAIIASNSRATIVKFAFDKFNTTKQHVHLYKLDKAFSIRTFEEDEFPWDIEDSFRASRTITLFCFPKVKYTATLANPFRTEDLVFYQPVKIVFKSDIVIVQFTILEKNVEAYFNPGDFIKSDRVVNEEDLIKELIEHLQEEYSVEMYDINKGIKHLWDLDVIDSKFVKYKKAKSTSTEAMDEGETVKASLPKEYADLMGQPLQKTVFKYLKNDSEFCNAFAADPTQGELTFTRYPDNENQIDNVIDKILSNN